MVSHSDLVYVYMLFLLRVITLKSGMLLCRARSKKKGQKRADGGFAERKLQTLMTVGLLAFEVLGVFSWLTFAFIYIYAITSYCILDMCIYFHQLIVKVKLHFFRVGFFHRIRYVCCGLYTSKWCVSAHRVWLLEV